MRAFISYSHKDAAALERLHTHLAVLQREKTIEGWYDRNILAGDEFDEKIAAELAQSDLFLALVSPDFLASPYCHDRELAEALARHRAGTIRVVPIILEPCDWQATDLGRLKAVPRDGKPVSDWTNANTAYLDVVVELRRLSTLKQPSPVAPSPPAPSAAGLTKKYRVKRDFDAVDRAEFRRRAFEAIRDYFEKSVSEINGVGEIGASFWRLDPAGFTCSVLNRARHSRGIAHLTVHAGGSAMLSDISFNHQENGSSNTANGTFSVAADEYEQFLSGGVSFMDREAKLTPAEAARQLWEDLLERAGISVHD